MINNNNMQQLGAGVGAEGHMQAASRVSQGIPLSAGVSRSLTTQAQSCELGPPAAMAFGESLKRVFARNKSMASLWPSPSTEAVWQSIPTPPHWWLTEGAVAQGGSRAVPDAIPVVAELEGSSAPLRRHDPMSASPTTTQHVLIEQDLRAREGWAGAQAVATDENRLEFLMQVLEASAREQSTALAAVQDATVAQLRDAGHAIEALRAESCELRERTEARHGELQGRVADLERQLAESRERVARTEPILALLTKQAILTASGGGLQSGIRGGSSSKKSLSDFTFGPDHATACTSLESCHKLLELVCRGETLLLCDSCGVPQAGQSDLCTIVAAARDDHIETFSDLPQQCCQRNTCKPCGAEKLLESLETKWWQDLSADDVVRVDCLAKNCSSVMSITSERKFFKLLRSLGVRNPDKHIQAYTQARVLRPHLLRAAPPVTEHASGEARILHRQLEAAGFMVTQLALIKALESDNSNNNSGELVTLVSTDRHGVNLQIPVFTGLLKRSSNGGSGSWSERTCCICASTFPGDSLAISSEAAWVRACEGFGGNWMWKIISSFPLSRHLGCSRHHEVNFCRGCLATHMNTKIEELGSARCHLLSCMMPECGRRLTYEEVKFFASTATFEKYDRYLLLNRISSDPNFRWCLREGCQNGQIVPDMAVHNLPEGYYSCDGCGFEMCSSHQTVWHTGMTCAEVSRHQTQEQASERQERDSSRQWIEQNTKTCPGCDVRIEKNAGCFHMTCSCGFEFCWECLADWRSIVRCTNGNATYISTGHNASCFFHGADLQPTQLAGRTLEEALQGRA